MGNASDLHTKSGAPKWLSPVKLLATSPSRWPPKTNGQPLAAGAVASVSGFLPQAAHFPGHRRKGNWPQSQDIAQPAVDQLKESGGEELCPR